MKKRSGDDKKPFDITIVGGLGHAGLPLGIVFAHKGLRVCLYDTNRANEALVRKGKMPFIEYGAEPILKEVLRNDTLKTSSDIKSVSKASCVIIAIGTPLDEYLNPRLRAFLESLGHMKPYLSKDQLIIVRSTVYPNTCAQVFNLLGGLSWKLAYCPERITQGYGVKELGELPQLISGFTKAAVDEAEELFRRIAPKTIRVSIKEAELSKLFTNAWRYIQFAATNQFYMIAHRYGVSYDKVRKSMVEEYGRAATLPSAGFAAGPCLLKDTMQLAAFYGNNFHLGHAAMMVNEGLPAFLVEDLRARYDIAKIKVGILGMAFKADIDDIRGSLSYKLGKILRFYGARVYYSDEYAKDPTFVSKEKLISSSDVVIIGVPHRQYKGLSFPKEKEVIDLWGITKTRTRR